MWLLDNFKPFGRMQRAEYFMRSLLLLAQLAFWAFNVFAAGMGAALSGPGRNGDSMKLTFLLVLCFGFLIAWQGFVLMLRRLQDIGWNPIFAFAGYAIFWLAEFFYFSTVPEMMIAVEDHPLPISWLGVTVPLILGLALLLLPSAPEGVGHAARDGGEGGSSWADAIKIPSPAAAAPAGPPATGERRRTPRGNTNAKPQFGNRPARER